MPNYLTNIIISIGVLILLMFLVITKCSHEARKELAATKRIKELEKAQAATKAEYEDSLSFVRGQQELQQSANIAHIERIRMLEHAIDDLQQRHAETKKKIKPLPQDSFLNDTGFVLAPNEYVNECEQCFSILDTYKKENNQLAFERDSYDSLLRRENRIHEGRITQLMRERDQFKKAFVDCDLRLGTSNVTRKVKLSAMGMLNNLFLPNGGGAGLIYEDKRFNEYGGHVLFTGRGNIYLIHVARTISFKRKK